MWHVPCMYTCILKGGRPEYVMCPSVPLCQSVTQKDLVSDYLYVGGPPPGHLNRDFNGYQKMEIPRENSEPGERIPNMCQ
jgi:hypothetical protein